MFDDLVHASNLQQEAPTDIPHVSRWRVSVLSGTHIVHVCRWQNYKQDLSTDIVFGSNFVTMWVCAKSPTPCLHADLTQNSVGTIFAPSLVQVWLQEQKNSPPTFDVVNAIINYAHFLFEEWEQKYTVPCSLFVPCHVLWCVESRNKVCSLFRLQCERARACYALYHCNFDACSCC